jgi:hypothetical protein
MIQYPSIVGSREAPLDQPCFAFYKYDGQNLRWEWSKKKGWWKYGTRTTLFDESSPEFAPAIPLFMDRLAGPIESVLYRKYRHVQLNTVTVFTEWYGDKSIAGIHQPDDPKKLRLFDVVINDEWVPPRLFVKHFGHLDDTAEVVYRGPLTQEFITSVQEGTFDTPLFEGVVCKGEDQGEIYRCKIKTNAYREELKRLYQDGWENFWE